MGQKTKPEFRFTADTGKSINTKRRMRKSKAGSAPKVTVKTKVKGAEVGH